MRTLDKTFLTDAFRMDGDDAEEFASLAEQIDKATKTVVCQLRDVKLLTPLRADEQTKEGHFLFYYFDPAEPLHNGRCRRFSVEKGKMLRTETIRIIMDECLETGQFLFYLNGSYVFASGEIYKTMAQRINAEYSFIRDICPERDIFLAKKMDSDSVGTIVCRQMNHVSKAFAFMGPKYTPANLLDICRVYSMVDETITGTGAKKYGRMECVGWNITQKKATIRFSFPELGERIQQKYHLPDLWVPCLELSNSNIGQGAFLVRGGWLVAGGYFFYDRHKYVRENRGEAPDCCSMYDRVIQDVLDPIEEFPQRMELLQECLVRPEGVDGDTWSIAKNTKAVYNAYKTVFRGIDMVRKIGKTREKNLNEFIRYGFIDEEHHYTLYEIILDTFSLPKLFTQYAAKRDFAFTEDPLRRFKESMTEAPYVNFGTIEKEGAKILQKRREAEAKEAGLTIETAGDAAGIPMTEPETDNERESAQEPAAEAASEVGSIGTVQEDAGEAPASEPASSDSGQAGTISGSTGDVEMTEEKRSDLLPDPDPPDTGIADLIVQEAAQAIPEGVFVETAGAGNGAA